MVIKASRLLPFVVNRCANCALEAESTRERIITPVDLELI